MFVALGGMFVVWEVPYSESAKSMDLGTEIVFSGFGEITLYNSESVNLFSTDYYQDTELGFQVSKPNNTWDIHSILDELNSDELASLKTKGFLDGVYVEKNHDKRFIITIFDIQKDEFSLHEFIDQQISVMESQKDTTIPFKQISSENYWALFAVEYYDESIQYSEQLLFLNNDKLYMLQYLGESPQMLNSDQKNYFRFIMDSFEVI